MMVLEIVVIELSICHGTPSQSGNAPYDELFTSENSLNVQDIIRCSPFFLFTIVQPDVYCVYILKVLKSIIPVKVHNAVTCLNAI